MATVRKKLRHLFAKMRIIGPMHREDRILLVNFILETKGTGYRTIESFNDLTDDEIDYLLHAIKIWEVIQESRLYTGILAFDRNVMELAKQYQEVAELAN